MYASAIDNEIAEHNKVNYSAKRRDEKGILSKSFLN